jgi:alkylated DNA nucleotide flippase Atl1
VPRRRDAPDPPEGDAGVEGPVTPLLAVLDVVDAIPPGRVMTYGDIARYLGLPSPRQVGQILARRGHEVPWHRVVMADGRPASPNAAEQLARLREDRTPLRNRRVDLATARWRPPPG